MLLIGALFLFPGHAFASYPTSFESVSHSQGWLVPNDYTTAMNPPSCKARQATGDEKITLAKECDSTQECVDLVSQYVDQWKYCKDIGMVVRTVDGKQAAYFPPSTPEPTIEPISTMQIDATPTPTIATSSQQEKEAFNIVDLASLVWAIVALIIISPTAFILTTFFIKPALEMKRIIRDISIALTLHDNLMFLSGGGASGSFTYHSKENDDARAAVKELRTLAGKLTAQRESIWKYEKVAKVFGLPTNRNTDRASTGLIGYSNSMNSGEWGHRVKFEEEIRDALKIKKNSEIFEA